MGETKGYTKGPWKVFHKKDTTAIMTQDEREVIQWGGFDASDFQKQRLANARLIASAPDMDRKLTSALVSIRERMGLYEKDFGFTESMDLDDYDQAAQGPQWNRAYGNYESLMEMRDKLKGE